jgi:ketosteroid isomerase-like protein
VSAVDVARAYFEALAVKDFRTARSLLDPDVEIVPPSGRAYGLRKLVESWNGPGFDHLEVSLEDRNVEPDGGGAVVHATQVYRWKEDGEVAYERKQAARYEVRDGRIVRIVTTIEGDGRDG